MNGAIRGELSARRRWRGLPVRRRARLHAVLALFTLFATLLAALLATLFATPLARAALPELLWPVACTPNQDCWIANHVDLDPGPGIRDYKCGVLTYESHNGTDIAIRDRAAMEEGVRVLAAAAGRVRGTRDGVADTSVRDTGREAIKDRECGNGAVIDHGGGWETQYCHLRRGSLKVKRSEQVAAGQPLGLVGLSGLTEYPHLHFTLRHHGRTVDPFRGDLEGADCSAASPLWRADVAAALAYAPGAVYNAGFAPERPDAEGVRSGRYRKIAVLPPDAPVLTFFADVFGVGRGDTLEIRITGPDGRVLAERRVPIERRQARQLTYLGVRRTAAGWLPGVYRGEARLIRADGGETAASSRAVTIEVGERAPGR